MVDTNQSQPVQDLIDRGMQHVKSHNYEEAGTCFQQALADSRSSGNRAREGFALSVLGTLYSSKNEPLRALEFWEQALAIAEETDNRGLEYVTSDGMGFVFRKAGKADLALRSFSRCLDAARALRNSSFEVAALSNLGIVYRQNLNDPIRALEVEQKALEIAVQSGDNWLAANVMSLIGNSYADIRDARAIKYYEDSLRLLEQVGAPTELAFGLGLLAKAHYSLGNKQLAIDYYLRGLSLAEDLHDDEKRAMFLTDLVIAHVKMGALFTAARYLFSLVFR